MKEAEKILNKFIKGDIARDYDKVSRKHHTVTLQTALEAINVALNKPNVRGRSELLIDFFSFYAKKFEMTFTDDFMKRQVDAYEKSINSH